MRLEKIKLSGFKSFVDPTTVLLPSNLVAVVGPNGCGKSNVIDAVRWVMGESSARLLRGESMADVIFNGSGTRKPVGQAIIELIFDNSDGAIAGPYANYAQVSIKRLVSRDGLSNYFLNNLRCRRRDITDLFLGTGLGPRSYSIIEQGTISRLIEARPEDLRAFLEEAAGISKYKERRRETEHSINSTKENLVRLTDIRDELAKRLQHLQRQATLAEKYQALRAEEQQIKGKILALRWRVLEQGRSQQAAYIEKLESEIATTTDQLYQSEIILTEQRDLHEKANKNFNELQNNYYLLGTEIAGIEQALKFKYESNVRIQGELEQITAELAALESHERDNVTRLTILESVLAEQEPQLVIFAAEEQRQIVFLEQAEESIRQWQASWDELQQHAIEPNQLVQVERAHIAHLEQQIVTLERRHTKLEEELQQLDQETLQEEITDLQELELEQKQQIHAEQERLQQAIKRIQVLRVLQSEQTRERDVIKDALQSALGRKASLETLQQAALNDGGSELKQWLTEQKLDKKQQLLNYLEVSPTWQTAVEEVLGSSLHAYCVASLDSHAQALTTLDIGPLQLFETDGHKLTTAASVNNLSTQIHAPWTLTNLLGDVDIVDDLPQALAHRHQLTPHQSVITPNGIRVGRNWLRIPGVSPTGQGLLERAAELKILAVHIHDLIDQIKAIEIKIQHSIDALTEAEDVKETTQESITKLNAELSRIYSYLSARRAKMEHLIQRNNSINGEIDELNFQLNQDRELVAESKERLVSALEAIEHISKKHAQLLAHREPLREKLELVKTKVKAINEQSRQLTAIVTSTHISKAACISENQGLHNQIIQLEKRKSELVSSLTQYTEPKNDLELMLNKLLEQRRAVELELNAAKVQVQLLDTAKRDNEQLRQAQEQALRKQRNILDQTRNTGQELLIRIGTLEEQLKEGGHNHIELLTTIPATANPSDMEVELERCAARLQRLGPVNLAAIDELGVETARKDYLDSQHEDISHALDTLEGAIRKIDRETKNRFKDIFDRVNDKLRDLFPRLFGGGQAYLELTGEELLSAGVTIMARPPGKRNSNIHMLSGGEKALTAMALVFSIFQLNPAPFCMLDEVDAPLDDANVGRFCDLVRSMAHQVQFIFITHNKVTMELANQLIGVTMHEPGVSRLVTVDIENAIKLAVS